MLKRTLVLSCLLLAIAGADVIPAHPAEAAAALPKPDHIVIVVEENHSKKEIIGNPDAPYINSLAKQGTLFTNSHAIEHPSQPNYLDLFSGSNQGVTNDTPPRQALTAPNLGSLLLAKHYTFWSYMDGMPYTGFTGDKYEAYYRKHNPAINFSNVPKWTNHPFTLFPTSDFNKLPTVSFVVPDLNHDMHDGTIAQGDAWLKKNLDSYVKWAQTHNSMLILTWDEDDYTSNNLIPTVMVGPMVKHGVNPYRINHYRLLRTVEDMYGIGHAGKSKYYYPIRSPFLVS